MKRWLRRAWKRLTGRVRLSEARKWNQWRRHLQLSIMRSDPFHGLPPGSPAEINYSRLQRQEKRLKNIAHGYPPFLPTHLYAGILWPDLPLPPPSEVIERVIRRP